MFQMLNDMLELIYVSDTETYDLLFINTAGREMFHIDELDNLKCYKALQGLDEPCPFCTNHLLSLDKVYSWEVTNPVTNRHYLLKDRLVEWNGKVVRMEIAFDATESENEKIELKNALDAEQMVMECAKQLYQTADIAKSIQGVLERVGTFLVADRTFIFDIRDDKMFNSYEWCAEGIEPQIEILQDLDISLIDSWRPHFDLHECVIISDLEEIKDDEPDTYEVLSKQKVTSLVVAPLEKKGELMGYLGVDNPPADKVRNITALLHTLRFFLMAAMRRAEDEQLLAKLSYYDTLTGFYNRNRFMQDISGMAGYKGTVGLAYLDVNGLKDCNDRRGHSYGDQVLFICARKIAEAFECGDFYRIGGDEFVVICKPIQEEEFLVKITELRKLFVDDKDCNAAIGYEWVESLDDIQEMVSKADALMYSDKKKYYDKNSPSNRYREWHS